MAIIKDEGAGVELKSNELFLKELNDLKEEINALFDRYEVKDGISISRINGRTICSIDVESLTF